jgi:dihydrofolate synthase / folylpolyglutamate synthase
LKLSRAEIEHGINTAEWPGRVERVRAERTFLLDGAHNEQAVRALCSFLEESYPQGVPMIFGCMADKNYEAMLRLLKPRVQDVLFTKAQSSRSQDPAELVKLWPGSMRLPGRH